MDDRIDDIAGLLQAAEVGEPQFDGEPRITCHGIDELSGLSGVVGIGKEAAAAACALQAAAKHRGRTRGSVRLDHGPRPAPG
jgi:hypothetical protein